MSSPDTDSGMESLDVQAEVTPARSGSRVTIRIGNYATAIRKVRLTQPLLGDLTASQVTPDSTASVWTVTETELILAETIGRQTGVEHHYRIGDVDPDTLAESLDQTTVTVGDVEGTILGTGTGVAVEFSGELARQPDTIEASDHWESADSIDSQTTMASDSTTDETPEEFLTLEAEETADEFPDFESDDSSEELPMLADDYPEYGSVTADEPAPEAETTTDEPATEAETAEGTQGDEPDDAPVSTAAEASERSEDGEAQLPTTTHEYVLDGVDGEIEASEFSWKRVETGGEESQGLFARIRSWF